MAYDERAVPTPTNIVRFLIQDVVEPFLIADTEIVAMLDVAGQTTRNANTALEYTTASICLGVLLTRFLGKGKGLGEKQVKHLKLTFGSRNSTVEEGMRLKALEFKREAALRSGPGSFVTVTAERQLSVES